MKTMTSNPTTAIRAILGVVEARLDAAPRDPRDWKTIVDQLREAARAAERERSRLTRCGVCGGCVQGGPCDNPQ